MEGGGASLVPNANFEGPRELEREPPGRISRGRRYAAATGVRLAGRNGALRLLPSATTAYACAGIQRRSPPAPNTQYDAYAWVQGDIDTEDSWGQWILRVLQYDSAGSLPELGGRKLRRDASHCLGAEGRALHHQRQHRQGEHPPVQLHDLRLGGV